MKRIVWRKPLSACLALIGVASLSYLLGAGTMFYRLPASGWLANAFLGARLYLAGKPGATSHAPPADEQSDRGEVDIPEKTFDGFTYYTCTPEKGEGTQAFLVDMQRRLVHRWAIRFSDVYPNPTHLDLGLNDSLVCFFGSYLYPNGDLLVIFHGPSPTGCGLAKLDASSNLLWAYPAAMHHDVDVAEDGTIYALEHRLCYEPPAGFERAVTPCFADYIHVLSPDGKPLRDPIAVLDAFRETPYVDLLATLERPGKRLEPPLGSTAPQIHHVFSEDPLHTNCVRVLRSNLSSRFPLFKDGQVMISLRNLSVIGMLDPNRGRVTWAARGPWLAQHDPQFLENGHLLIFDNLGSPKGSRVLQYDPVTQAIPWSYSGSQLGGFYTSERGMCQRLPNGNTFVVNSEGEEMLEVTPAKELVWSYNVGRFITTARRYAREQLTFLDEGQNARP